MKKGEQKTVYVAMSGGVDSSVAAALLKKEGFRVVGVFMKPWQEPGVKCLWQKDREDAMRVAAQLDIPFKTWDFSHQYGRKVTSYMIDAYQRGSTPNPDVMCNREIKFGLFLKRALKEGADLIATGHYARVRRVRGEYQLRTAEDSNKDQTYFLWTLTQDQLSKTLFPVGDYTKPAVRKLAKRFHLPTFDKKDSQGVCFIGPLDMKSFLTRKIAQKPGKIIHVDGRELGMHDGAAYYTIGQRHGLSIGKGDGPFFVVRKDMKKNIVFVGSEKDLLQTSARVAYLNFISTTALPLRTSVKVRYRTEARPAVISRSGILTFKKPQRAITSGQSAVFYRGARVLGGGIIR